MTPEVPRTPWESRLWVAVLIVLVLVRLPAFVAPAGSDQHLYMYVADRILAGGAPYVDAWDQKPPGVHLAYAFLRLFWPATSAVALMDLLTAVSTAFLLIVLGRRLAGPRAGYLAAAVFLLFGDPSIARLDGLYLRGQCETLIAVAATGALVLTWQRATKPVTFLAAGACLGAAFWLKYNAVAYGLPVLAAALGTATAMGPDGVGERPASGELLRRPGHMVLGGLAVSFPVLAFLWGHDGLTDWWLATIDYNLQYSRETYTGGFMGGVQYALMLPIHRIRMDFLWFLGAVGTVLFLTSGRRHATESKVVLVLWLAAALASILLNGARDLPQYFLQAKPALALAFGLGMTTLAGRSRVVGAVVGVVLVAGLWKVGTDAPGLLGFRWGGLPQAVENVTRDLDHARGRLDRQAYLSRFIGQQKYDAAESDALTSLVADTTSPDEPIFVFGFSPGVYLESGRVSASRFFWSRPVILEFAAAYAGYGSHGLLGDLERTRPSIVALQKKDWGPGEPTSYEFMLATPHLRVWLDEHYTRERDTPFYSIWRRRP